MVARKRSKLIASECAVMGALAKWWNRLITIPAILGLLVVFAQGVRYYDRINEVLEVVNDENVDKFLQVVVKVDYLMERDAERE